MKISKIFCEWGEQGITQYNNTVDVMIIVDVLSFSTCVDIVVANGSRVYPFQVNVKALELAEKFAISHNAILAGPRKSLGHKFNLSPQSLLNFPQNNSLVLPSPNGSTLTCGAKTKHVITACLRNATAVAKRAQKLGCRIAVIPAGERWSDGSLRVAYEDLIGAGAIIHALAGDKAAEAEIAENTFLNAQQQNFSNIFELDSSIELKQRGFGEDIELAVQYDVSKAVPILNSDCYQML